MKYVKYDYGYMFKYSERPNTAAAKKFDDDVAEIIQEEPVIIEDAYLLFYKKVDMPTSSIVIYE